MEDAKTVIIPTGTKARISHKLSFPIGAERISIALASVPQLPELVLHFRSDRWNQVRFGHYPFLSVTYSGKNWNYNPVTLSGVPLFNKWEIEVKPVPRTFRHRIQQYILDSALPQIRQWLDQRADLAHEGTDTLGFFFDEEKEEFVPKLLAHPQPLRGIKQKDSGTRTSTLCIAWHLRNCCNQAFSLACAVCLPFRRSMSETAILQ